jgi:hypothetical protein
MFGRCGGMIGLLLVALVIVCTVCVVIDVVRLVRSYWREDKRETGLRREAVRAECLLDQAKEIHRLAPSRETRLLVVLGEACCDMVAATQAEDWETAFAFRDQAETIEALLAVHRAEPVVQSIESWHRERLEASAWN